MLAITGHAAVIARVRFVRQRHLLWRYHRNVALWTDSHTVGLGLQTVARNGARRR